MDIVYVVAQEEDNEPLRYSLRSLQNIQHDKVYMSGYTPSWVQNVISLSRNQTGYHALENTNLNLQGALLQPDLSDDFILMMDDVFIMEPIEQVLNGYAGTLDKRISVYKTGNRLEQATSLMSTRSWLKKHTSKELLNYELHFPYVFNKQKLIQLFMEVSKELPLIAVRPRTLYNNYYNTNNQEANDAKDSTNFKQQFLSVGEDFNSELGAYIRAYFTNPSPYEREPGADH